MGTESVAWGNDTPTEKSSSSVPWQDCHGGLNFEELDDASYEDIQGDNTKTMIMSNKYRNIVIDTSTGRVSSGPPIQRAKCQFTFVVRHVEKQCV